MVYCNAMDVRLIIHTSLSDAEIEAIIAMSCAHLDKELGTLGTSDILIKKLSVLVSAMTIKGRQPKSSTAGEYREDSGDILELWALEVAMIKRLYKVVHVIGSSYHVIDETNRYGETP